MNKSLTLLAKYNLNLFLFSIIIILFINCSHNSKLNSTTNIFHQVPDSITFYLNKFDNSTIRSIQKNLYLKRAYVLSGRLNIDTLRLNYLTKITNRALHVDDSTFFFQANRDLLNLSTDLKDTLELGEVNYRFGTYFYLKQKLDSSFVYYNKAYKLFEKINEDYHSGRMLYGMAIVKNNFNDFTGSEKFAFQAIRKFKPLSKNTSLCMCYNLMGINYNSLKEFDKSLFYYKKAIEYLEKSKYREDNKATIYNNLGNVYAAMGNYKKAIENFNKALEDKTLKELDLVHYTRVLDNLTYSRFLNGDTTNIERDFKKVLRIRDSIKRISGVVISKVRLAEYYASKKDTLKAIVYSKDAVKLSSQISSYDERLEALMLISKLDKENSGNYLESYINLKDSLQSEERAIRNKSIRIEYETDEYIAETKRLSTETKRLNTQRILISVIGGILVIVLGLLYFIRLQRAKNKELLFEQEQQRANEEIYGLMAKQQSNLEQGKVQERQRISEELHDGVLGKLFGTRVGMGFLSLTGDKNDVKEYKSYLDELQGIEKEIRDISHALKNNILKSENSFIAIIEEYVGKQSKVHGFDYDISNEETVEWGHISDKLKVTFYRIIQESIQNIVKHAEANNVKLIFAKSGKLLHLSIEDDGKGFVHLKNKKGIGFKNMESRVFKYNGTFQVDSNLNQGTIIKIAIPV